IIANSNFTRNLLIKGGVDAQRIRVIHPGTDPHQFCPGPKPNELIHQMNLSERKVALSVGRLTVRKGQDMTIEAWPKVLEKVPNAVYLIVGTGEYEHHLRELAKKMGVERSICFIGEVTAEELPRIYRMADLFIMPSRQLPGSRDVEGFGIVYLEAGASGLPCIGGRCGGIPDAIEDGRTGILVDGDSPNEIALAVVDLFNNPKRASSMGDMARHRVLESFTWERSATNIRRLIDSIERDK
ncbi:MAG: glycosyltransferase family 4 protein, partial [Deltaproteobacteria bacterium]|nr:glycosyltransferase family 4 protein [Deltaproteobacteria bacterium]